MNILKIHHRESDLNPVQIFDRKFSERSPPHHVKLRDLNRHWTEDNSKKKRQDLEHTQKMCHFFYKKTSTQILTNMIPPSWKNIGYRQSYKLQNYFYKLYLITINVTTFERTHSLAASPCTLALGQREVATILNIARSAGPPDISGRQTIRKLFLLINFVAYGIY